MNEDIGVGNVYCLKEPKGDNYIAFQIIEILEQTITFVLLDYYKPIPFMATDAMTMQLLCVDRWYFKSGEHVYRHGDKLNFPCQAQLITNRTPLISGECRSYSSWPTGTEQRLELEWRQIPEVQRTQFKAAISDTSIINVAGMELRKSYGSLDHTLLDKIGSFNELEVLQAINKVSVTKWVEGLIPFLEQRRTISELQMRNQEQEIIDLRGTNICTLFIETTGLKKLYLPDSCSKLSLIDDVNTNLQIYAKEEGSEIWVLCTGRVLNHGLTQVTNLTVNNITDLNMEDVAATYPRVEKLGLHGKPGFVTNFQELATLASLKELRISELFGFTKDELPAVENFPHLESLSLISIPEEVGKEARKRFKKQVTDLYVSKLRKPEWLAENLDNPLRGWDGSEFVTVAQFKKSIKIYKETRKAALELIEDCVTTHDSKRLQEGLEELAKSYATKFNILDGKSCFIETDEREDLCMAFQGFLDIALEKSLAVGIALDSTRIEDALDGERDW